MKRTKNPKERIPTGWQAQTLRFLMDGYELIITTWPDACGPEHAGKERIYWRFKVPQLVTFLNPDGYDTMDCGSPKRKRYDMSHLERYGWVKYTGTTWEITEDGRKAKDRYDAWFKAACESLGSTPDSV